MGDLRPENVFLAPDARDPRFVHWIKVLDFGVAKLLAGARSFPPGCGGRIDGR